MLTCMETNLRTVNPVNTATNGPPKIGRINGMAVLTGGRINGMAILTRKGQILEFKINNNIFRNCSLK